MIKEYVEENKIVGFIVYPVYFKLVYFGLCKGQCVLLENGVATFVKKNKKIENCSCSYPRYDESPVAAECMQPEVQDGLRYETINPTAEKCESTSVTFCVVCLSYHIQ